MSIKAELERAIAAATIPADWIGIRATREQETERSVRDGQPAANQRSLTQGAMVEVLAQGQFGYAATNQLTPAGLHQAIQSAYHQAIAAYPWRIYEWTTAQRPKVVGTYHSPCVKALELLSPAEINDLLLRICQALKVSDYVVQTDATVVTNEIDSWFVSSNGSDVSQHLSLISTHYGVIVQDGSVVQQRSNNGYLGRSYQGGWERFPEADLWATVDRVGAQAMALLTAAECPTEATTLVLAPDQMMLQIHESIGHPLELDRILGDERNYAGGSFVKPSDFGQLQYGSDLMNITFDPTVEGEYASYQFDDTGAPATREYLIRAGKLERGLGSLESQARLGVPGVACARASSWNRPPIDRMANINLEPGEQSFHDLIAGIERGVYMATNRSWSIDDQRHKFQFGCEYAQLIENGQLTKPLRNPNYRATTPQFWHSLVAVGDRSTWAMYGTALCGKGEPNQAIRVGHGAPVCAFANIEVFGGAV